MKHSIYILTTLLLVACQGQIYDPAQAAEAVIVYRDKPTETLADIAYDLLEFNKYNEALELVQDDTSMTALTVKIIANDGLGNIRESIDYAILDLRSKDTARFYEGSWELWDLYMIFKKDINYGLERLNVEYIRCHSNYQVRQLMMKLYWYLEDYEKVVALGDEFRKEFPNLPNEVTFNHFRQDSLDSLLVKDQAKYDEIMSSYMINDWNGVERINRN
jgi:hypothetical protein